MAKNTEQVLDILGSGLGLAGKLIFGPEANFDAGEPFRLLSAHMKKKREDKGLLEALGQAVGEAPPEVQQQVSSLIPSPAEPQQVDLGSAPTALGQQQAGLNLFGDSPPTFDSGESILPPSQLISGGAPAPAPAPQAAPSPIPSPLGSSLLGAGGLSPSSGFGSDFISRVAQQDPDFARKLIERVVSSSTNPLNQLLTMERLKKAQNEPTPEERRRQQLEDRASIEVFKDELLSNRQTEQKGISNALSKEKLTSAEIKSLTELEDSQALFEALPNEMGGSVGGRALSEIPVIGAPLTSVVDPAARQFTSLLRDAKARKAFATGGKQLTVGEKREVFEPMPSALESPEQYTILKDLALAKIRYRILLEKQNLFDAGRRGLQLDPTEITRFKALRQIISKKGVQALEIPEVAALAKELGVFGLARRKEIKKK